VSLYTEPLFEIRGLKKYFPVNSASLLKTKRLYLKAVDGVDLFVYRGETLGIVGESGCGKSTLGRTMIRLLEPTEGRLIFDGKDITDLSNKELRPFRKDMQMMFQDPYASLDPRMTTADIIAEPMDTMKTYDTGEQRLRRIVELMEICGINKAYLNRYPHEFSGGQRQRIGIARALSLNPRIIVCDEPVSALDVSIQSQIINLLMELRRQRELAMVFISHDLGVVEYISNRVAVMYLGRVVELADTNKLFADPLHPYTKALLSSIPQIGGKKFESEKNLLEGELPSPINPPAGCTFHTRCFMATDECKEIIPAMKAVEPGHAVSCIKI
jgi:oligopeptide/dipeptide ABC transporter ATP-binding protein